jgi:hypothetical protein
MLSYTSTAFERFPAAVFRKIQSVMPGQLSVPFDKIKVDRALKKVNLD